VGVKGGYTQQDVTSLAHLFTGWGAQREANENGSDVTYQFRFSPYLTESAAVSVFGLDLAASASPETADDRILQVLEMLAARPQTAEFVSRKLIEHYVGAPADESLVKKVSAAYLRNGGDMREMLKLLAQSPELMRASMDHKLLQPVEFGICSQRSIDARHPWSIIGLGDRSGRNLFDRSTPDGYPEENEEYSDSNSQLQKWSYVKEIEAHFVRDLPWEWFEKERLAQPDHRAAVIRAVALGRTGRPLGEASVAALDKALQQNVEDHNQRRQLFGTFFMMLPEMQYR
jgi:uncharacterized protein (DUF1800 family)